MAGIMAICAGVLIESSCSQRSDSPSSPGLVFLSRGARAIICVAAPSATCKTIISAWSR